ncbi:hypothetical protein F5876DRAFT_62348, partial [Lentinula aff. lateritia]
CPTIIIKEKLSGNDNALAPTEFGFLPFEFHREGYPLSESLAHLIDLIFTVLILQTPYQKIYLHCNRAKGYKVSKGGRSSGTSPEIESREERSQEQPSRSSGIASDEEQTRELISPKVGVESALRR